MLCKISRLILEGKRFGLEVHGFLRQFEFAALFSSATAHGRIARQIDRTNVHQIWKPKSSCFIRETTLKWISFWCCMRSIWILVKIVHLQVALILFSLQLEIICTSLHFFSGVVLFGEALVANLHKGRVGGYFFTNTKSF